MFVVSMKTENDVTILLLNCKKIPFNEASEQRDILL